MNSIRMPGLWRRVRSATLLSLAVTLVVTLGYVPPSVSASPRSAVPQAAQLPEIPVPPLVTDPWDGSEGVPEMDERWRQWVADTAESAEEPEIRDAALAALATGDNAVIMKFVMEDMLILDQQVSDRKYKEAADNLAKVKAMKGTGAAGGYFNAEVTRVLAGSAYDRVLFLAYGARIARERDEQTAKRTLERAAELRQRVQIIAAGAAEASQVKRAAEAALAGGDTAIATFLKTGYLTAANADAAEWEQHLKDLEERNKAAEELTDLAKRSARANEARRQLMVAHGEGVKALMLVANAMGGASNNAREAQRIITGSDTVAVKNSRLTTVKDLTAAELQRVRNAAELTRVAAAKATLATDVLVETGLEYGIEWARITQGMNEAASAALSATQTAAHAIDATIATNNAQGAQAQAVAREQQAITWNHHAEEHARAAARLAASAQKQAAAAKTAAARAKTAREQAEAAERTAAAEAAKVAQQRKIAEDQAAEAARQRQNAEAERANAERHRIEAERQAAIASTARGEADRQAGIAGQARTKAEDADQASANAEDRAWDQEANARQARDAAISAERDEQTAKAKAQAFRAAAASADTEAERLEAVEQAAIADREAATAGNAARSARAAANTATGAAADSRAAATRAQHAADMAWAAHEKARSAARAADAAADKAESGARATHAARVLADSKAAQATAQQVKAAAAADTAQRLASQANDEAGKSLRAADRTRDAAQAATTEAVAASSQADDAVAASQAAATSAAGIADPANTAIAMVRPFTGTDIDADFVVRIAEQAKVIGAEQAAAASTRATEASEAARLATEAADRAATHVKFAYQEAAKAAQSAASAARSAAEAKQSAAEAAAEGAAARLAAANAARHDAQARADATAARAAANAAASDANAAGRSAQDAQNDADRADQAATAAEADAAAARQAADSAEADAAAARRAADSAQQHVEGATQAASNALQHAVDAQKAADQAEEAERERQAQAIADAAAGGTLDPLDPDLLQYLTPEQQAELRQANSDAGLSVLDFLKVEAADLLYELSGVGDLVRCFRDGNIEACLWSLAGLLGGIKAVRAGYKIVKALPKIVAFIKKLKDANHRRHLLLELARRLKKEAKDRDTCEDEENSFLPGTPVLLADGSTRPIEELKIGDLVVATDPINGVTAAEPVTATITGDGDKKLVDITIDTDGDRGTETATVTATHNHPFWVPALSDWVDAEHLSPQQWLRTSSGTLAQISAIGHRTANTRVHNLTVADVHTYYVTAKGTSLLTHNNSCHDLGIQISYTDTNNPLVLAVHNRRIQDKNKTTKNYGAALLKNKTIITGKALGKGAAGIHSEEDLIIQAGGINNIEALYTERAPCARKCDGLLRGKNVKVYYTFSWNHPDLGDREKIQKKTTADLKEAVVAMFKSRGL
ncbi:polymorphic toxin-type HINT domain-containing protein [Actinoplanes derwentensis]|uniref:Intein N-terminal splicing region n=2 Tax=Actinoplanes derwentensis TaxID=113562 RepID=A0A1H1Z8H9_9ACTN|nr:polymorphic toxin-type HINT domain-containing protein [Actinoplanes derwentensis]SDT30034.1 intein N-terminal splicing region [Actinoplanes derwentensis]